jgi:Arc/MetJ family transcription regulator
MEATMRINVEIDDKIMQEAMHFSGFKTKKETVEAALKAFCRQRKSHRKILDLVGKIEFDPAYNHKQLRESKNQNKF